MLLIQLWLSSAQQISFLPSRILVNYRFPFLILHFQRKITYLSLHRVPQDVGSAANKFNPCTSILSIPICQVESGACRYDVIFPSLPWSSLSVCARDSFHEDAFGMAHVVHSTHVQTRSVETQWYEPESSSIYIYRRKFWKGLLQSGSYLSNWCSGLSYITTHLRGFQFLQVFCYDGPDFWAIK